MSHCQKLQEVYQSPHVMTSRVSEHTHTHTHKHTLLRLGIEIDRPVAIQAEMI